VANFVPCSFSLNASTASYGAIGGSGSVNVTTSSACPWTAASNAGWITITSGGGGIGNGTVNYSVAANSSSNSRTGTMTIAALTFTFAQAGNMPPQVSIPAVSPITLPTATVNLCATVTDDGAPYGTLSRAWSKISGWGNVTFGNANAPCTTASFSTNGTYLLRLTASDGAASASNDVTVIVNGRPSITSTPTAVSNTLLRVDNLAVVPAGEAVEFSVGAMDPDGDPLSCQWVFCDGITNTDCDATHIFSDCGPCTVSVTVTDNLAAAVSSNMMVSVPCRLDITKLQATLNFAKTNADSGTVKGRFDLPADYSFAGKLVTLDIGGTNVSFTLDSKGKWHNGPSTFSKPTYNKKTKLWTFNATLKNGSWQTSWAEYSMINSNIPKPGILVTNFPVILVVDTEAFMGTTNLHYTAKHDKSGTAK
jgi:hypothetical protein